MAAHRVLVADDQREIRDLLTWVVERTLRAEVLTAKDGGEALYKLEEDGYAFDLLLLDMDMPRASGPNVLSAMASIRPEIPVVLTSANPSHEQAALDAGASAFLSKPFEVTLLIETLHRVLAAQPLTVAG